MEEVDLCEENMEMYNSAPESCPDSISWSVKM